MPFKAQIFLDNVAEWVGGAARDELVSACEGYARLVISQQKSSYIRSMMNVLDRELDEETRWRIMASCGRRCIGVSTLEKARRLQKLTPDLDDLLCRLNEAHIGGGHLQREGDVIHAVYDRCFCGSVRNTKEPFSSTYCHCSCGWYQQLFETLLDKHVEVVLLSSIIQGDEQCKFLIKIGGS